MILNGAPIQTIFIVLVSTIPVIVFSLSIHEWAHAYSAYLLGDPTAYMAGRMKLNPLVHLDPIGTLMLLIVGFGFAKPVPIDTRYFKHPRGYTVIVSLAGPFSNLLLAILSYPIMRLLTNITIENSEFGQGVIYFFIIMFYMMVHYNIVLAVFNLLILPPLDGSKIILALLPQSAYMWVMRNSRNITYISYGVFLILSFTRILDKIISVLSIPIELICTLIWSFIPLNSVNYLSALMNIIY